MKAIAEPASPSYQVITVLLGCVYAVVQFCSTVTQTIDLPTFNKGQPYLTPVIAPAIAFLAQHVEQGMQPFALLLFPASILLLASLLLRGSIASRVGVLILAVVQVWGVLMAFHLLLALAIADGATVTLREIIALVTYAFFYFVAPILLAASLAFVYGTFVKRRATPI